jgi:uncharacterized NAD-dependent epimerase/dehydratase family protein
VDRGSGEQLLSGADLVKTLSFEQKPSVSHLTAESATATDKIPQPYLLFLGDVDNEQYAKTAFGLRDWAADRCVGEFGSNSKITTGLPYLTPAEAYERGARSLVIGVANLGGYISDSWLPALVEALSAGLDIVSGMHHRLADVSLLETAAARHGRRLIDVRRPPAIIPAGTGLKRSGKRLLTVGTDCSLGKKYMALSLASAFQQRGIKADFRATGQTGILIAGSGIPIDAVVADFLSGAAEMLSPDAEPDHWDVIEGQGSIFHPTYAGVSLGLLHGSQPDVIVVCHDPSRQEIAGMPGFPIPSIEQTIDLNLVLARRTNPAVRCGGVGLNTSKLSEDEAARLIEDESERLGMIVADPIRGNHFPALVEACLA